MLGVVDPERLFVDAECGVAGHVEGEQARWPDLGVMAEPDEKRGEGEVEDQLVEERRLECVDDEPGGRSIFSPHGMVVCLPNSSWLK